MLFQSLILPQFLMKMIERSDEIWFPPMICENIFRFAFERAVDKRFLGTGRQACMSARVLRFTFTNEEITELLSIGCVKLNVSPFECEGLAKTQSCFEK